MCGRFALYSDTLTLAPRIEAEAVPELRASYNAPHPGDSDRARRGRETAFCASPLGSAEFRELLLILNFHARHIMIFCGRVNLRGSLNQELS
jgi:hypothetical protein